jgi:hypothetical protein
MNSVVEANIIERLHHLDEPRKAEVLDFVEYLLVKFGDLSSEGWPVVEPARDFASFAGKLTVNIDAVAYQRHIRDSEWS